MRVLLVNTNRIKPAIGPIGLDYVADTLEAAGHHPDLLDLCFSDNPAADIAQASRKSAPDIIGVTIRNTDDCYLSSQAFFLPEIKDIIGILRRTFGVPVVLGGAGYSVAPKAVLEYCGADFGIAGEGELALVELLSALDQHSDLAHVPNLVYRNSKSVRQTSSCSADLSRLPPRRRAFVDNSFYFRQGGQAGFETKRGCSMSCVYCADPVSKGRTVRLVPPQRVAAELSALVAQGIDHFHTCDSEFNLPANHARDVCRAIIDAGLAERIRWYAYCSPTPFDDETALLFKRAGCAGIDFGADSGCDEMLARLGRHFTSVDLARTAAACKRHGIAFMYDLLLGSPGETRETIRRTIDLMRRLKPDCVGLALGLRIYPGTPVAAAINSTTTSDPALSPNLYGARHDNRDFLKPVFFLSPDLGEGIGAYVRELVAGDPRFFLPEDTPENRGYNYNDNTALVRAIAEGARGAYWHILRRLRPSS
jgi:radical SAM superfamily enzyme YgiQ (UPF0313 family)